MSRLKHAFGITVALTWRSDPDAIRTKWSGAGGAENYGHAAADQEFTPGGNGAAVRFSKDFSVYYTPTIGARTLTPPVRTKYWQLGSVSGIAGFPRTDVQTEPDPSVPNGQFAEFQNLVSIYSADNRGNHWISGAVRSRFEAHGPALLGYPSSDQSPLVRSRRRLRAVRLQLRHHLRPPHRRLARRR